MNLRIPALIATTLCLGPMAHADWEGAQALQITNTCGMDLDLVLRSKLSRVGLEQPAAAGADPTIREVDVPTPGRAGINRVAFPAGQTLTFLLTRPGDDSYTAASFVVRGITSADLGNLDLYHDFDQPGESGVQTWILFGDNPLSYRKVGQAWLIEQALAQEALLPTPSTTALSLVPAEHPQVETKTWHPDPDEGGNPKPFREAMD